MVHSDTPEYEPYVYNLDSASLAKAKTELHEDPRNTQGAIDEFRKWIEQQPWLKTPTDDKFLLSFLRNQKFSQLLARQKLTKYWTSRTENPGWFSNIDVTEDKLTQFFEIANFVILPRPDKEGRLIIVHRLSQAILGKTFDADVYLSFFTPIVDYLMMNESVQIHGIVFIDDYTGVTFAHLAALGRQNMDKLGKTWMNAFPLRYKAVHFLGVGPVFQALLAIFKAVMTTKLVERIKMHGHMFTLYDHIDKYVLPKEWLADDYIGPHAGSFADVAANLRNKLQTKHVREAILDLSSGKYGVDLKTKPKLTDMAQESFRKLNIE